MVSTNPAFKIRSEEPSFGQNLRTHAAETLHSAVELLTAEGRRDRRARFEFGDIKPTVTGLIHGDIQRKLRFDPLVMEGRIDCGLEDYHLRLIHAVNGGGLWYRITDRTGSLPVQSMTPLPPDAKIKGVLKYFANRDPYLEVTFSEDRAYLSERAALRDGPGVIELCREGLSTGLRSLRQELAADRRPAFDAAQDAIEARAFQEYRERRAGMNGNHKG